MFAKRFQDDAMPLRSPRHSPESWQMHFFQAKASVIANYYRNGRGSLLYICNPMTFPLAAGS
jgi:hypothetical protein